MSRLQDYINEKELSDDERKKIKRADLTRKKSKQSLKKGLIKLDNSIDAFIEDIEKEIDNIEDQPQFQYRIGLMLANMEKEQAEFLMALRQIVQTIGKKASIIPQTRAHSKGAVPEPNPNKEEDEEDVRNVVNKDMEGKNEQ